MKINQNVIEELIAQAQKDAPNETCGYLLGHDDIVTENYWMEITRAFLLCAQRPVCGFEIRTL